MSYSRLPIPRRPRRYLPFVALTVVMLLAIGGALYTTNRLPFWRRINKPPITHTTANSVTKGESGSINSSNNGQAPNSNSSKNDVQSSNEPLIAPTGTFISSHHLNSVADSASSSCTTTPGATCQITFTQNGVTKSLSEQTTDAGGATYWGPWRPQDYGLTAGTWTVTAVAKVGSHTLSTKDALQLEIGS